MDKREYQEKLQEINRLIAAENYEGAAKIADSIDWKRVRNVQTLVMISEVYEVLERYEDSKVLLLRAYRRSPVGRTILYRLVECCIRLRQFDQAIEYYSEYVQAAPHDNNKYILKYKIYRGRGASLDEQIDILKEYLDQEYNEKWAYELARLQVQAGRTQEGLATCDDLVLWFQSGKYVIRALELKKKYAPLTPKQQEIYDNRFAAEEEPEVRPDSYLSETASLAKAERAAAAQEEIKSELAVDIAHTAKIEATKVELSRKAEAAHAQIDRKAEQAREALSPKKVTSLAEKKAVSAAAGKGSAAPETVEKGSAAPETMEKGSVVPETVEKGSAAPETMEKGSTAPETMEKENAVSDAGNNTAAADVGASLAAAVGAVVTAESLRDAFEKDPEENTKLRAEIDREADRVPAAGMLQEPENAPEDRTVLADGTRADGDSGEKAADAGRQEGQTEEMPDASEAGQHEGDFALSEAGQHEGDFALSEAGRPEADSALAEAGQSEEVPDSTRAVQSEEVSDPAQTGQSGEDSVGVQTRQPDENSDLTQDGQPEQISEPVSAERLQEDMVRNVREIVSGVGPRDVIGADEAILDEAIEQSKEDQENAVAARGSDMTFRVPVSEAAQKRQAGRLTIDDILLSMGDGGERVRQVAGGFVMSAEEEAQMTAQQQAEAKAASYQEGSMEGTPVPYDPAGAARDESGVEAGSDPRIPQFLRDDVHQARQTSEIPAEEITEAENALRAEMESGRNRISAEAEGSGGKDRGMDGGLQMAAASAVLAGALQQAGQPESTESGNLPGRGQSVLSGDGTRPAAQSMSARENNPEDPAAAVAAAFMSTPKVAYTKEVAEAKTRRLPVEEIRKLHATYLAQSDAAAKEAAKNAHEAAEKAADMAEAEMEAASGKYDEEEDIRIADAPGSGFGQALAAGAVAGAALAGSQEMQEPDQAWMGDPYGQAPQGAPAGQPNAPFGQQGAPAGQPNAPFGQQGAPAGQPNAPFGQQGAPAGQPNAPFGQQGAPAGQPDALFGQQGIPAGQPNAPFDGQEQGNFRQAPGDVPFAGGNMDGMSPASGEGYGDAAFARNGRIGEQVTREIPKSEPEPELYTEKPMLTASQMELFRGFTSIGNLTDQIAAAIWQAENRRDDRTSRAGNILILGAHGCGKTTIATGIAKAIAEDMGTKSVKMARIYAADLNRKDIAATIAKIAGGVLIVEEAGDLDDGIVDQLTTAMEFRTDGLIMILEDEQRYIHELLMRHPRFTMKFTAQIYIPEYTEDDLVNFGQIYALGKDHVMSEKAVQACRDKIEAARKTGDAVSVTNVIELVDRAIKSANTFFRRIGSAKKRYDEEDRVILREKDFR